MHSPRACAARLAQREHAQRAGGVRFKTESPYPARALARLIPRPPAQDLEPGSPRPPPLWPDPARVRFPGYGRFGFGPGAGPVRVFRFRTQGLVAAQLKL